MSVYFSRIDLKSITKMDSFGLLAYLVGTWFISVDNPKSNKSAIFLRMSVWNE